MAYVSEWEPLLDATHRVMATAGMSKDQAQIDICRAIADGAIKIRGALGRHGYQTAKGAVLQGADFQIPPEIKPADLDWEKSRPRKPSIPGFWDLEWIQVCRADVTKALCATSRRDEASQHRSSKKSATRRNRPVLESAKAAIKELYPEDVPGQAAEPNSLLCRRVGDLLKQMGRPHVSDDTILRAAGRRK
jgi:hypothetical protein